MKVPTSSPSTNFLLNSCPGETDWKILAIDVTDSLASEMNGTYDEPCELLLD